ncbi:VUT family protein [Facilibium subflavum]|uniref:VUT family protein n=1 Tax=Facilibium subflavum TaxID=2219058 RepID=UPI000E647A52|nr:VUT family protein [Facilibium subflavum]
MINQTQLKQINKENNIYILFVVAVASLSIICNLIMGVEVIIPVYFTQLTVPASALFYVLTFMFCDLVAEIYGFEKAVRVTVYNVIAQAITCGIVFALLNWLPANIDKQSESIMYFFTLMSREFISSTLALIAAKTLNDFFIVYLRDKLAGRFFGIRTILSTVVGEIVMLEIDYNYSFRHLKSPLEIQKLIWSAMVYKMIAAVLLAFVAVHIANYLRKNIILTIPPRGSERGYFVKSFFKAFKIW